MPVSKYIVALFIVLVYHSWENTTYFFITYSPDLLNCSHPQKMQSIRNRNQTINLKCIIPTHWFTKAVHISSSMRNNWWIGIRGKPGTKLKSENKTGVNFYFSACHWCHVIGHSFEDDSTAEFKWMNTLSVSSWQRRDQILIRCIWVLYNWSQETEAGTLNCFTLPDGKPIYGGTYFPNASWKMFSATSYTLQEWAGQSQAIYRGINTWHSSDGCYPACAWKRRIFERDPNRTISRWKKLLDQRRRTTMLPKFPKQMNFFSVMFYWTGWWVESARSTHFGKRWLMEEFTIR